MQNDKIAKQDIALTWRLKFPNEIKSMSDDDLFEVDYFLHEDHDIFNILDDDDADGFCLLILLRLFLLCLLFSQTLLCFFQTIDSGHGKHLSQY